MKQQREKVPVTPGAPTAPAVCTHHWVIEPPSGAVSQGRCKLCGEERVFKNYLDNTPYWEDDVSLDQVSSGSRFRIGAPADAEEEPEG